MHGRGVWRMPLDLSQPFWFRKHLTIKSAEEVRDPIMKSGEEVLERSNGIYTTITIFRLNYSPML